MSRGAARRATDAERDIQPVRLSAPPAAELVEQQPRPELAHVLHRLSDGREIQNFGHLVTVEPDHSDVLPRPQAVASQGAQSAERHLVRHREDGGRR